MLKIADTSKGLYIRFEKKIIHMFLYKYISINMYCSSLIVLSISRKLAEFNVVPGKELDCWTDASTN